VTAITDVPQALLMKSPRLINKTLMKLSRCEISLAIVGVVFFFWLLSRQPAPEAPEIAPTLAKHSASEVAPRHLKNAAAMADVKCRRLILEGAATAVALDLGESQMLPTLDGLIVHYAVAFDAKVGGRVACTARVSPEGNVTVTEILPWKVIAT
jgi:hypothetical protein